LHANGFAQAGRELAAFVSAQMAFAGRKFLTALSVSTGAFEEQSPAALTRSFGVRNQ
jgi:hypothetical protein